MTLDEITAGLRQRVGADAGLNATIKFDFGDDGLIFLDGKTTPNEVTNEDRDADCTIRIKKADFEQLVAGDLDPTTAYMMGKLKVDGSLGVAMKLSSLLG